MAAKLMSNGSAGANLHRSSSSSYNVSKSQESYANGSVLQRTETSSSTFSEVSIISTTWKQCRHRVKSALGSDVDDSVFHDIDIDTFMEYISSERLTNMPHRGGRWDKVLKSAEYFALQLAAYQELVHKFGRDSELALRFALGCCRLLLDVSMIRDWVSLLLIPT